MPRIDVDMAATYVGIVEYGGGPFRPANSILLVSNDPEPGECIDGGFTQFHSLAQPGEMPQELSSYTSDGEFVGIMQEVNAAIQRLYDRTKCTCIPSVILWPTTIGPCLLFGCLHLVNRPKCRREIEGAFKPLASKGLTVKVYFGTKGLPNKIQINLPRTA